MFNPSINSSGIFSFTTFNILTLQNYPFHCHTSHLSLSLSLLRYAATGSRFHFKISLAFPVAYITELVIAMYYNIYWLYFKLLKIFIARWENDFPDEFWKANTKTKIVVI